MADTPKPLIWIGSSRRDLKAFPKEVRQRMGFALWEAQQGGKHLDAKPLKGFGGASMLEVVVQLEGNAFRAVYTVKFAQAVYVLHAFQKKSRVGIATPMQHLNLVKDRLREAKNHYEKWLKTRAKTHSDAPTKDES